MAENDYRDKIDRDDFLATLEEMSSDEIKYKLKTHEINDDRKRALAEIELDNRREESELAKYKSATRIAVIVAVAAIVTAIATATTAWW